MGRLDNVYLRPKHSVRLKNPVFTFLTYFTCELSGHSYNLSSLAEDLDKQFKGDDAWFNDYKIGFVNYTQAGLPVAESHRLARLLADQGRF